MDIEGFVRRKIDSMDEKSLRNILADRILEFKDMDRETSIRMADAVIYEVKNTLKTGGVDDDLRTIISYPSAGVGMGEMGVGSRGEGDFFVHRRIADIVSSTGTRSFINPEAQDDGGVVRTQTESGDVYITTAVDGIHSRLSEYPFLGGFHVTRAALRDVCVMGSRPVALISDLHLADDGDVGKLFDFTAGVAAVSELVEVPVVAGSTLRVGGDMVLGDRLVSAVGAIGFSETPPTARRRAEPGDSILLTEGSGGGTITTTAIYHGLFDVVWETLDVNFIRASEAIMDSGLLEDVHAMTDVTNGGLRGDAHEISSTAGVGLEFDADAVMSMINPRVLGMLQDLDIDPLGVSIDSLMIIAPDDVAPEVMDTIRGAGVDVAEVGRVTDSGVPVLLRDGSEEELRPLFREAAYTQIKKMVGDRRPGDFEEMKRKVEDAARRAIEKKDMVVRMISRE
ncbi:hypothetical protein DNK57_03620 [Methanothermobacter thermautotrophicus]|jgi:hydrogenase expression/formation protein|uniref:Uncharacterized protein n=1 Tax=Methanothermobacter thermautotrophicus TaxID=145262 RepID=A0A842YLY6_METTF|nr:AIR synthase-related protein [Methanothermobacter thermautotrophicus]MBE2899908.1 hypothetical protein [Methanothermobacter thermautotrophicus]MCQ8904124.1 AIR synthase-related protein [Methanothermobacter sp.]